MVYELRVKSLEQLFEHVKDLEVDTGIRAEGKLRGKESLIFITRHSGKYALWIRARNGRSGERGTFLNFSEFSKLHKFLEETLNRPLRAHIY